MILVKQTKMSLIGELPLLKSLMVKEEKIKEECEDYVCSSSSSVEEDAPLDLRVNCGRMSPARDSGTESDDTEDKMMVDEGDDYKPFKKNLIKRCKSFLISFQYICKE